MLSHSVTTVINDFPQVSGHLGTIRTCALSFYNWLSMSIFPIKIGEGPRTGGLINMSVGFLFVLKPQVEWKSSDTKIVPVFRLCAAVICSHWYCCLIEEWYFTI